MLTTIKTTQNKKSTINSFVNAQPNNKKETLNKYYFHNEGFSLKETETLVLLSDLADKVLIEA